MTGRSVRAWCWWENPTHCLLVGTSLGCSQAVCWLIQVLVVFSSPLVWFHFSFCLAVAWILLFTQFPFLFSRWCSLLCYCTIVILCYCTIVHAPCSLLFFVQRRQIFRNLTHCKALALVPRECLSPEWNWELSLDWDSHLRAFKNLYCCVNLVPVLLLTLACCFIFWQSFRRRLK